MLRTRHIFLLVALCCLLTLSCGTTHDMRRGQTHYAHGEYYAAAQSFRKVYNSLSAKDKALRGETAFSLAESYRHISQPAKAAVAYANAIRYHHFDTLSTLYLADMLRMKGDYKAAANQYRQYLSYSLNHRDSLEAMRGIRSCSLSLAWKQHPTRHKVRPAENTLLSRRNDYAPIFADAHTLYFTSTRDEANSSREISDITGQHFADIFYAKRQEDRPWQKPIALDTLINTADEEGTCCFTPDGRTMYFTRCRQIVDRHNPAQLFMTTRTDGDWSEPVWVKIFPDSVSSIAHPTISPDGQFMVFSSDFPGGEGGFDLWSVRLSPLPIGLPINLGPSVNTPRNEVFPSFAPGGALYFSSDGHPGMGGLDLFRATKHEAGWTVENLQSPMNSSYDDFSITFQPDSHERSGYFSSNRNNPRGTDKLYLFTIDELQLLTDIEVTDQDGNPVVNAIITIANDKGFYEQRHANAFGRYSMPLTPETAYSILASAKGHLNTHADLYVTPTEADTTYTLTLQLANITRPIPIENIYFDYASHVLSPQSAESLNHLIATLQENPNLHIEITSHCDYKGSEAYNQRLSQRRAQAVTDYLTAGGIQAERLTAKGMGKSQPKVITRRDLRRAPFLRIGDTLTENFILQLPDASRQERCNEINRRTEFRVIRY